MVGKPVSEKTRSKKSSILVNGKIKSPKNVGTNSALSGCTCNPKVTKKKSRNSKDSDIAIKPSYISESDYVKVIDEKSRKGKKSEEKNRGTKRGLQKNRAIDTLYSELKPRKKKKKKKKVGDEDVVVLLEEGNTTAGMKKGNNNEGKKEDKNLKGKEVKVKSPEKSKKGNGVSKRTEGKKNEAVLPECKNDSRKKKVEGEKERNGKRRNEDENTMERNKKRRTEVEEAGKQRGKQLKEEGAEKEKKQKKVEVESKKVKKKRKNEEEEIVMEEENSVLYQFPMAQVSRMIKSEDFNSKIAHEAVFVINKASEKFLELFCREAYASAFLDRKNQVAYNHLASVVSKRRRFDFLSDFIPQKVKAEDALAELSKAEAETDSETT